MNVRLLVFLLVILLGWEIPSTWSDSPSAPVRRLADRPAYVPGEILVKFKAGVRSESARFYRTRHNIQTRKRLPLAGVDQMALPDGMTVEDAVDMMRQDPEVEFVEPNFYRHALTTFPGDTSFDEQWGLHQGFNQVVNGVTGKFDADVDAPEAWDTRTDCSSMVVAVIDSGIDPHHPDLSGNLWINPGEVPGNGIDDDDNGYIDDINGWNFIDFTSPVYKGNNDIQDSSTHGTAVAGILAARGNNNFGISGVCWQAKIMVLKFMNAAGDGSVLDEVAAIDYAIANGAKIINASFGDYQISATESDAIQRARDAGLLFVAAAGNDGNDNDITPIYPASYGFDNILSVAATDQNDRLPAWSNDGRTTVDLAAPGNNIYTTKPGRRNIWAEDFEDDTEPPAAAAPDGWSLETPPWRWIKVATDASQTYNGDGSLTNFNPSSASIDGEALAPPIDLGNDTGVLMSFYLRRASLAGNDTLYVETATNGGAWTVLPVQVNKLMSVSDGTETTDVYRNGISGQFTDWRLAFVSFTHLDGRNGVRFRFRIGASGGLSGTADGWMIDDILITAAADDYTSNEANYYHFESGTSFATPMVSGVAALVWSHYADLDYCQIAYAILNGGDALEDLTSRTLSGRRLNAYGALTIAANDASLPTTCTNSGSGGGGSSGGGCFVGTMR